MAKTFKPHLKLNPGQQEAPVVLKFNYGNPEGDDNDRAVQPNYANMAHAFNGHLTQFNADRTARIQQRNPNIIVPDHIEYIEVLFFDQFHIKRYFQSWFKDFGLLAIKFTDFNKKVLFSISDRDKFKDFLKSVDNFIKKETGVNTQLTYSNKILYIESFGLLCSADIKNYNQVGQLMNFKLADFPAGDATANAIYSALINYLNGNGIGFNFSEESANLEIYGASEGQVEEVIKNFDIVLNVTSSLATLVKPSEFNLPERSYGFDIGNPDEELPIIGIIDTGISSNTPLASITIPDETFNLTGTSVMEDNVASGGHGTAIAALAALGKKAYLQSYAGEIATDAKLLSIKVLDAGSGYLSQKQVVDLLYAAKEKYPSLKIFVLSICYDKYKLNNEEHSAYAFELDKFAYEKDCLISICTANNNDAPNDNNSYDLNYFFSEKTNLCSPSESMNNITVGASAHSLRGDIFHGISISKEYPTMYSRTGHTDLRALYPFNKINKTYFKPDVIDCGGDYETSGGFIGTAENATMEVLSANPAESFYKNVGTSFSAPLVANVAAQIQKNYPDIKSSSIKALIINGASTNLIRFDKPFDKVLNKVSGHGLVNETDSVFSNQNKITILIEDAIEPEQLKLYPLHFPKYLIEDDLQKKRGIVYVTATLCFSFMPVLDNQVSYCPVHMAFNFFKNQTPEQIQTKEESVESLLKSTLRWSQSGRYKAKPIPCSNTQKFSFPVNVSELMDEENTFKLAVNCRIAPQLFSGVEDDYKKAHSFSIVISIEETLKESNLTGKLYDEVVACNELDNMSTLDADLDNTLEV